MHYRTPSRIVFEIFNYTFLALLALSCILPMIHVLAISFSSNTAASAEEVTFWPVQFNLHSYQYVLNQHEFLTSIWVSVKRIFLGTAVNMLLTILTAYPLSKESRAFPWRTFYAWFFVFSILFQGGLIPTYLVVKQTHLLDTIWALVIPAALPVFNMILLLNFFRQLPKELEEASFVDGAGHWDILWRVYLPLSLPALATVTLFCLVGHWNAWFDGLIYMNNPSHYPLQSYLQTVVINTDMNLSNSSLAQLSDISQRTTKSAQIFLGALPILIFYPFLQRFFMKGIVLGSVKE